MRPLLTCLMAVVCLSPAKAFDEDTDERCIDACTPYMMWGENCALQSCYNAVEQTMDGQCYENCIQGFGQCVNLCEDNVENVAKACEEEQCQGLTLPFCESRCFRQKFKDQYYPELHPLTPHDVGVDQGIPFFDSDESTDDD